MGETFMPFSNKVEKLAYLYGPNTTRQRLRCVASLKVETIPAIVDANQTTWACILHQAKRQMTVEQAKTLVEEL